MPRSEREPRADADPLICLVTDRRRLAPGAALHTQLDRIVAQADEAARAGVGLIQIREPDLGAATLLRLTEQIVEATRGARVRTVVNDRADVALAANAHGVHLRGDSFAAARVRTVCPPHWIVGRSVHEPLEAETAVNGTDYLIFGMVFPSASKPPGHQAVGTGPLGEIVKASPVPVLAIGGLTLANLREVALAGAAGVAAIELFLPPVEEAPDRPGIAAAVEAIRAAFGAV